MTPLDLRNGLMDALALLKEREPKTWARDAVGYCISKDTIKLHRAIAAVERCQKQIQAMPEWKIEEMLNGEANRGREAERAEERAWFSVKMKRIVSRPIANTPFGN